MEANGIECYECGYVGDGDVGIDRCPNEGEGEDHPIIGVFIEDCPNGVTAADWVPGVGLRKDCASDNHVGQTGQHVIEIDR